MDALSTILKATKLEAIFCNQNRLQGDWGLDIVQTSHAQFWRLFEGSCSIGLHGGPSVQMQAGDIVLIPHGARHWIANKPTTPLVPLEQYLDSQGTNGKQKPGGDTVLAAGHFGFDSELKHPFIMDLPPLLYISNFESQNQQFLQHVGFLLRSELSAEKPGAQVILRGIAEMLFIGMIRTYLQQQVPQKGFLSALADPQISKALELMHQRSSHSWTVEALGKQVGMSRTLFFNRFKSLVGVTPLDYLTDWRINQAKEMLSAGMARVDVAINVGYQSEAAFNRIFKTRTGSTPGKYKAARRAL